MNVGVLKESCPGEKRVAMVPNEISRLTKKGLGVVVQTGAGVAAGYPDADYAAKGAQIVGDRAQVFAQAQLIVQVRAAGANPEAGAADMAHLTPQHTLIAMMDPLASPKQAQTLAASGCTALALELMPRITRAQSMDVLSSMATIAGYRAVLLGAAQLPKIFPMLMTAAGTLSAAKVLVLGVGVAGLQAIATAKRLGAVVSAYDIRPEVKDQVLSVGGKFIELDLDTANSSDKGGYAKAQSAEFLAKQQALLAMHVAASDVVITTAAIPGRRAPLLVPAEMVHQMKPGTVIVDLAAETGGNCALTQAGQEVNVGGVTILGPTNIVSAHAYHASQMLARNISTFILHLINKEGVLTLNTDDEITRSTLVTQGGAVVHARIKELLS